MNKNTKKTILKQDSYNVQCEKNKSKKEGFTVLSSSPQIKSGKTKTQQKIVFANTLNTLVPFHGRINIQQLNENLQKPKQVEKPLLSKRVDKKVFQAITGKSTSGMFNKKNSNSVPTFHMHKRTQTGTKIPSCEKNSREQTEKGITKNSNSDNCVIACLANSVKIIEKIQQNFELSTSNNKASIEYHLLKLVGYDRKKGSEYDNATLANLRLTKSFYGKFEYFRPISMSDQSKHNIQDQIDINSEERMKEYSNLFNNITISIEKIKECIMLSNEQDVGENIAQNQNDIKRYSFANQDIRKPKVNMGFIENDLNEMELLKENLLIKPNHDEACDFSELSMFENPRITPPKQAGGNFKSKATLYQSAAKEDNIGAVMDGVDTLNNEEKTMRAYQVDLNEFAIKTNDNDQKIIQSNCPRIVDFQKVITKNLPITHSESCQLTNFTTNHINFPYIRKNINTNPEKTVHEPFEDTEKKKDFCILI